jgi:multicomponent Na+:H+ antiporter subunit G
MTELVGSLFILVGSFFLFSAGLGLLRMPDPFTRIQVGTKATTLGALLVLIGLAIYHPGWSFKLLLIVYFIFVSNPVSSHALARSGHRSGTPMSPKTSVDVLARAHGRTDASNTP